MSDSGGHMNIQKYFTETFFKHADKNGNDLLYVASEMNKKKLKKYGLHITIDNIADDDDELFIVYLENEEGKILRMLIGIRKH